MPGMIYQAKPTIKQIPHERGLMPERRQQIAHAAPTGNEHRLSNLFYATDLEKLDSVDVILNSIFSTNQNTFGVYAPPGKPWGQWQRCGVVELVYGNDGLDVIANNSLSLEGCLKKATDMTAQFERQLC